jgi:hypothetical protein
MESIWIRASIRNRILPFAQMDLKKVKTVKMTGFRAQIPTGDAPDKQLNAHCVTDYCYVLPEVI